MPIGSIALRHATLLDRTLTAAEPYLFRFELPAREQHSSPPATALQLAMSQIVAFQSGSLLSSRPCCNASQQRKLVTHRARLVQRTQRRQLAVRAKEDGEEKGKKIDSRKVSEKTSKLVDGMKKGGIDQDTAQRILDTWEKTGATSTDALRKMLLGRSLKTVGVVLFQLALDAGAAYGSYNSAR